MMIFKLRNKEYVVNKEDVEKVLEALDPELFKGSNAKYYIEFKGRVYPIKQVFAEVIGLPKAGFTTMDAYNPD
jgi:hypothetical protein